VLFCCSGFPTLRPQRGCQAEQRSRVVGRAPQTFPELRLGRGRRAVPQEQGAQALANGIEPGRRLAIRHLVLEVDRGAHQLDRLTHLSARLRKTRTENSCADPKIVGVHRLRNLVQDVLHIRCLVKAGSRGRQGSFGLQRF